MTHAVINNTVGMFFPKDTRVEMCICIAAPWLTDNALFKDVVRRNHKVYS